MVGGKSPGQTHRSGISRPTSQSVSQPVYQSVCLLVSQSNIQSDSQQGHRFQFDGKLGNIFIGKRSRISVCNKLLYTYHSAEAVDQFERRKETTQTSSEALMMQKQEKMA